MRFRDREASDETPGGGIGGGDFGDGAAARRSARAGDAGAAANSAGAVRQRPVAAETGGERLPRIAEPEKLRAADRLRLRISEPAASGGGSAEPAFPFVGGARSL